MPDFQHRHYAAIAKVLSNNDAASEAPGIIEEFCELFDEDNPRFDRARFKAAAIGKPSTKKDAR